MTLNFSNVTKLNPNLIIKGIGLESYFNINEKQA